MSILQVVGLLLLVAPFVAVWVISTHFVGWRPTAVIFGLSAVLVLVVFAGTYLLTGAL